MRPKNRAAQHLLVQGFALYPCEAAVCTRLVAPRILDDAQQAWAVLFDKRSLDWTAMLPADDRLRDVFAEAAVRAQAAPHVVCHAAGETLVLPLDVADVRDARMRIEAAVTLKLAPPAERLEAFPDELIEREASRRAKRRQRSGENTVQGSPAQTSASDASSMTGEASGLSPAAISPDRE